MLALIVWLLLTVMFGCRDFTINSLFYNLNDDVVEDLTGKGLEDLRQGILRTPLPPQETFKDGEQHQLCVLWWHGMGKQQVPLCLLELQCEVMQALGRSLQE